MQKERGFTLIELLVALFISVVVGAATIGFMVYSHKSHTVQEQVADTQQNVRIGHEQLLRDVRMAGYGLERGSTTFFQHGTTITINIAGGGSFSVTRDGTGASPACNEAGSATNQRPGTDAIAVHRARGGGINVLSRQTQGANLQLDPGDPDHPAAGLCGGTGNCGGQDRGPVLFCKSPSGQSVMVQITNQQGVAAQYVDNSGLGLINPPGGVNAVELAGGTCYVADILIYYVNERCQLVVTTNPQQTEAPIPVASGVEDLQIAYFVDTGLAQNWRGTTAAPGSSVAADDPFIRLVRISMVTRTRAGDPLFSNSPQAVVAPAASLENHALSATQDNFRRRLLTSVVNVRNNGLQ